jgi:peptide/nickel transport system substrate-binding protein
MQPRNDHRRRWGVPLIAILLSAALAQTLVIAPSEMPSGLEPADAMFAFHINLQMTETLVGFTPGTTDPIPNLATAWWSDEDASRWTFALRAGVMFHDGTPFDAEAVKFNVDRWNDPDHPHGHRSSGKTYSSWGLIFGGTRGEGSILERVEVTGEHEVVFHLARPTANLPLLFGVVYFQISSPSAIVAAGADYGGEGVGIVGTGPFIFEEWIGGESLTLRANPNYWGGAPQVARLVYRFIPDPLARYLALRAGAVDIAASLPLDEYPSIAANPDLVAVPNDELNLGWLGLTQLHPPLDQLLVRRAIAHAIDRQALLDAFHGDLGVLAEGFVHPSLRSEPTPWPYPYDPTRARALLREAGVADGFEIALWYRPTSHATLPAPRAHAEAIASYLADVGIRARIETVDPGSYNTLRRQGEFALHHGTWTADFADPDNFLMTIFGPRALTEFGYDAPEVLAALEAARVVSDGAERAALYRFVEAQVAEAVVAIPMAHSRALHAHRSNIENWVGSPLGFWWSPLKDVVKR